MHYNAFISYKHEKKDIEVAKRVQAGLERFQVPASIRKRTGKKKIERIFRDKDELPITSDLGETISEALDNSDYLIVICSTHTRESEWVQREIEYFLKTHSKREVLTVLVDGEPGDVIPTILLNDEKTEKDENGNERKIITVLEPLSCDYRVPNLKAMLRNLGDKGFLHVLCEGGLELACALAKEGLVDEWLTVLAPKVIGHGRLAAAVRIPKVSILADF